MSIGDRLRSIRASMGLGQEAMAARVGLGAASWKRLELENRAPKGEVLAQLSEVGISVDWLLTGSGQMLRGEGHAPLPPIDETLLAEAIGIVEQWLIDNKRTMSANRKAEVVSAIYAMSMEDLSEGKEPLNNRKIAHILKLAV